MSYRKTNRKNKKPGEYKQRVSRRNKGAVALHAMMDKMFYEALIRDKS